MHQQHLLPWVTSPWLLPLSAGLGWSPASTRPQDSCFYTAHGRASTMTHGITCKRHGFRRTSGQRQFLERAALFGHINPYIRRPIVDVSLHFFSALNSENKTFNNAHLDETIGRSTVSQHATTAWMDDINPNVSV